MSTFRDAIESTLREAWMQGSDIGADADAVIAMPEMEAIRKALLTYADIARECDDGTYGMSREADMRLNGLPDDVIAWVLGGDQ